MLFGLTHPSVDTYHSLAYVLVNKEEYENKIGEPWYTQALDHIIHISLVFFGLRWRHLYARPSRGVR